MQSAARHRSMDLKGVQTVCPEGILVGASVRIDD
jgi:hypothetical protein